MRGDSLTGAKFRRVCVEIAEYDNYDKPKHSFLFGFEILSIFNEKIGF